MNPEQFNQVAAYEQKFGKTIQHKLTVIQQADKGRVYDLNPVDVAAANSATFNEPIIVPESEWKLPAGAFGESCGPV